MVWPPPLSSLQVPVAALTAVRCRRGLVSLDAPHHPPLALPALSASRARIADPSRGNAASRPDASRCASVLPSPEEFLLWRNLVSVRLSDWLDWSTFGAAGAGPGICGGTSAQR
jgi:hypothetical protein